MRTAAPTRNATPKATAVKTVGQNTLRFRLLLLPSLRLPLPPLLPTTPAPLPASAVFPALMKACVPPTVPVLPGNTAVKPVPVLHPALRHRLQPHHPIHLHLLPHLPAALKAIPAAGVPAAPDCTALPLTAAPA